MLDTDGDGRTNLQEFAAGTDPADYYDGEAPVLTFFSGHQQTPAAGEYFTDPVVVRVSRPDGTPLANAPLLFRVRDDAPGGGVAIASGDLEPLKTLVVRSDANGLAQVFWKVMAP